MENTKGLYFFAFVIVGSAAVIAVISIFMCILTKSKVDEMSLMTFIKREFWMKYPEYGLLKELDRLEEIAKSKNPRTYLLRDTEDFFDSAISKKLSNSKDEATDFLSFTLKTLKKYSVSNDTKAYVLASLFHELHYFFDDDSLVYNNYTIKSLKDEGLTVENSENNTVCNFYFSKKSLLEIFTMIVNGQIDTKTSVCTKVKKVKHNN